MDNDSSEREMMFVVYRLSPMRVYSIHRDYLNAAKVKDEIVASGEDIKNIETLGLYVRD